MTDTQGLILSCYLLAVELDHLAYLILHSLIQKVEIITPPRSRRTKQNKQKNACSTVSSILILVTNITQTIDKIAGSAESRWERKGESKIYCSYSYTFSGLPSVSIACDLKNC